MANQTVRPYDSLRSLVDSIGGTMVFVPVGHGGDWEIRLHGRSKTVPCRDRSVNDLDRLYVANVPNPQTWADYDDDASLADDAFWRLVDLMR